MCIVPGVVVENMLDLLGTKNSILNKDIRSLFETEQGYNEYHDMMFKQFDRQIEALADSLAGMLVKGRESIDWDAFMHSFLP